MLPLWPKAGRACKLLLLRGIKDGRTPFGLLPGLTLHGPDGGFTPEAEAILRGGASLDIV
jgi:tRNA1(Val) A37 N6-methylase TrmN6